MDKLNDYFINKIFTIPYIDKMIGENKEIEMFLQCVSRYVKDEEEITYGDAIQNEGVVV